MEKMDGRQYFVLVLLLLCALTQSPSIAAQRFLAHLDTTTGVGSPVPNSQLVAEVDYGTVRGKPVHSPAVADGKFSKGVDTNAPTGYVRGIDWGEAPGTDPINFFLPMEHLSSSGNRC